MRPIGRVTYRSTVPRCWRLGTWEPVANTARKTPSTYSIPANTDWPVATTVAIAGPLPGTSNAFPNSVPAASAPSTMSRLSANVRTSRNSDDTARNPSSV